MLFRSELGSALRGVFAPWAGDHRPTVTAIGVAALAYPEVFLEIEGTALVP